MNGLFLIDKPADMTSFGVVARIRRLTGEKCGHSGTLDPFATGLLPVMVGKATKLCSLLTEGDKEYIGTLRFGVATDSGDLTGKVIATDDSPVDRRKLETLFPQFTGEITQRPPAYSAIKVNGVPLYRLARKGQEVEVPERKVSVHRLELLSFDEEAREAVIRVACSKGTYIRSLFSDLAAALGTVGTTAALRRTRSGSFSVEEAASLEALMKTLEENPSAPGLIPVEKVLEDFPRYEPADFFAGLLQNGCAVDIRKLKDLPRGLCTVYRGDTLLGLGDQIIKDGETCFKVVIHL